MIITVINLSSFRRFSKETFSFSSHTTIIVGANASGKTSILEAIYLLALGKSFRAERDMDTIAFESEIARVKGVINNPITQSTNNPINEKIQKKDDNNVQLEMILTKGEVAKITTPLKKFMVGGVSKRMVDFVGNLKIVLFWPQDLELVTYSPSLRRRYLDYVLSQTDREYRRTLVSYERGLRQRNSLLETIRERGASRSQLLFWDQLLIRQGEYITKKRKEYIEFVNNHELRTKNLKQASPNYQLRYDSSIISRQRLDQYSEAEVAAAVTLVGPHRDDMVFQIQNPKSKIQKDYYISLSEFGSRGEQRLAVLWLKLAELSYIEKTTGEKPVLLLDDVLSELDHEHRHKIFFIMGKQQTILTITDKHFIELDLLKDAKIIELR